jgi:hypothetical protein
MGKGVQFEQAHGQSLSQSCGALQEEPKNLCASEQLGDAVCFAFIFYLTCGNPRDRFTGVFCENAQSGGSKCRPGREGKTNFAFGIEDEAAHGCVVGVRTPPNNAVCFFEMTLSDIRGFDLLGTLSGSACWPSGASTC